MISAVMQAFRRKPTGSKYRCLTIIEEFKAIGRIAGIENEAAAAAGSGMDLAFVVQGLKDIDDVYGTAADSIINNCAYKWFCSVNDLKTAEYLSKTIGKTTIKLESSSANTGASKGRSATGWSDNESEGQSTSSTHAARDLLTPDEVLALGSGTAILLAQEGRPYVLHPVPYWKLKETFAEYPEAFPTVYYDRNLALDPSTRQCAPMPPPGHHPVLKPASPQPAEPTYSGSKNYDRTVYAPKEMKAQPEPARPAIDWSLYAPKETEQPQQTALTEPPAETRSGSSNYDPTYYSDENIQKRKEKAAREKPSGDG
jgi:hypothetical protein